MSKGSFTAPSFATDNIQLQPDQPTISASALKLLFDQVGIDISDYLTSKLLAELNSSSSGDTGANKIGVNSLFYVADNVEEALNELAGYTGNVYNVVAYGADPTGVTDSTSAIQAAIDAANAAGGGIVYFPTGIYLVSQAGTQDSRDYSLFLKDKVSLLGLEDSLCVIKLDANQDCDIIVTSKSVSSTDISIENLTIDGNEANQTDGKFNLWAYDIDGLRLSNLRSMNPGSFGYRVERCTNVFYENLVADHSAELNADGLHLIDCSIVNGNNIIIDTEGDDGLIIEAINQDVSNINLDNIYVTAPVTTAGGGRNVLLLRDENVPGSQRNISNVNITNLVTQNGKSGAVVLQGAEFENIYVQGQDIGSKHALNLVVGTATKTGFVKNCTFDLNSLSAQEQAVVMTIVDGEVDGNKLAGNVIHDTDGFVGVEIEGDHWDLETGIDHDPNGTKASPFSALDFKGTNSTVRLNKLNGGVNGINLNSGANGNTFYLPKCTNQSSYDINIAAGATPNVFIGGEITTGFNNQSASNFYDFIGTCGATARGLQNITTNASGVADIPHGLVQAPTFSNANARGSSALTFRTNFTATNLRVTMKDFTGAVVPSTSFNVDWEARV